MDMLIQKEDLLPNYLINNKKVGFFLFSRVTVIYAIVATFTVTTTSFVGPILA